MRTRRGKGVSKPRLWPACALVVISIVCVSAYADAGSTQAASPANWPGYLYSASHSSYNAAATAITPANAGKVKRVWVFTPDPPAIKALGGFYATSTVSGGVVYIGGRNGYFYAINETTGVLIWKRFIGYQTHLTCGAEGFTSTATVASDPTTGTPTVYVYGATGYLYAMNATNGTDVWPPAVVAIPSTTVNNYYAWSSPLVSGGNIYLGVSSGCDDPLIRGALVKYSQANGSPEGTYFTTPAGTVGASIWSSVATDGESLFATTGNGGKPTRPGDLIIRVDPATMSLQDSWSVPSAQQIVDSDFGGSPTLFSATLSGTREEMVGACNKNGVYYALQADDLSAGPVWTLSVGDPAEGQCDAASVWDGTGLYIAGPGTSIGGVAYGGSVYDVNPATGSPIWHTGVVGPIFGSPTEDGARVISAATFGSSTGSNAVYLIDAANGTILKTISVGLETVFAQPVFADGYLFVAGRSGGLRAYAPPS